jgi:hypothetical protein
MLLYRFLLHLVMIGVVVVNAERGGGWTLDFGVASYARVLLTTTFAVFEHLVFHRVLEASESGILLADTL